MSKMNDLQQTFKGSVQYVHQTLTLKPGGPKENITFLKTFDDFSSITYECDQCIAAFKLEGLLKMHIATEHNQPQNPPDFSLMCDDCGQWVEETKHYKRHNTMSTDNDESAGTIRFKKSKAEIGLHTNRPSTDFRSTQSTKDFHAAMIKESQWLYEKTLKNFLELEVTQNLHKNE